MPLRVLLQWKILFEGLKIPDFEKRSENQTTIIEEGSNGKKIKFTLFSLSELALKKTQA